MKSLRKMWNKILFEKHECKYYGNMGECLIKYRPSGLGGRDYEVCNRICKDFEPREE